MSERFQVSPESNGNIQAVVNALCIDFCPVTLNPPVLTATSTEDDALHIDVSSDDMMTTCYSDECDKENNVLYSARTSPLSITEDR